VAVYLGATLVCCALTSWLLQLWRADLGIPFAYGVRDELVIGVAIKSVLENSWIFHNQYLGMPFGSEYFNVPQPDVFLYLIIKLLGLTTSRFGVVMNLFYLLSYPATFLCTLYVLRQFKAGYPAALLGSFLYTFLPYHFMRGEGHLFLGAYYFVPLVALLMFRVTSDNPPLMKEGERKWPRPAWPGHGSIGTVVICLIVGSSGVYYAFFACVLMMIAGVAAAAAQRRLAPFVSSLLLTGLIAATIFLCILPHLIYRHGNPVVGRLSGDAETYALKISQLLLPVSGHRLQSLAALKSSYYWNSPLVNENDAATLGFIGSLGFLALLVWAALRMMGATFNRLDRDDQRVLSLAALLTLSATLLATIGGFGSLFALLVSPQIRSYNRISVYIAFFAILAVVLLIDRMIGNRLAGQSSKLFYSGGMVLLTALGLYDQTSTSFVPEYPKLSTAFRSDAEFVRKIEARVPPGAMIFQLPYMWFPEGARYDIARGYLHSRTLRWSFGAMTNQRSDLWTRATQMLPAPDMVQRLAEAGFAGIYLDRRITPNSAAIEEELRALVAEPPLVSEESGLSFFTLPARPR
jgi:phosphoglycerol transferase